MKCGFQTNGFCSVWHVEICTSRRALYKFQPLKSFTKTTRIVQQIRQGKDLTVTQRCTTIPRRRRSTWNWFKISPWPFVFSMLFKLLFIRPSVKLTPCTLSNYQQKRRKVLCSVRACTEDVWRKRREDDFWRGNTGVIIHVSARCGRLITSCCTTRDWTL